MKSYLSFLCSITYISLLSGLLTTVHAADQPNILILLGDDIDKSSLGPWGGQAHTPHLDQLARDGVRLDCVYANVAMCAPFRQEFYSGQCAWRTGAMPNHSKSVAGTKSLPHYLQPLGYHVGLLGKKHIGPRDSYPFDDLGDLPKDRDANKDAVIRAEAYIQKAIRTETPFCLVVASNDGHGPYTHGDRSRYPAATIQTPHDALGTSQYKQQLGAHLAEVTNLDDLLGKLRKILQDENVTQNTLIIFCSEQGNAFPFSKWTCFESGLTSGMIAVLPEVIPAGTVKKNMTWIADVAPTLLDAAGGNTAAWTFDGTSQWGNLTGGKTDIHHYAYGAFTNCNILDNKTRNYPIRSIRDDRYTLIWSPQHQDITSNVTLTQALDWINHKNNDRYPDVAASWVQKLYDDPQPHIKTLVHRLHHRPEWALYDRRNDPHELDNLAASDSHKKVFERLQKALHTWLNRWNDSNPVATENAFIQK
ncbi:MAG: sulfatase-like hydrolase/transferase [Planctomycetaceae bacterium]|jgi:N-sulfoglucosamine sulfohydrolase|nr:sulfatase-like hydrolase/transferase [Planctomycetaceae bacterium]MBT6643954.1 sulfatase-like hydrolase/transferase [Planctomycetaceae bacterium]